MIEKIIYVYFLCFINLEILIFLINFLRRNENINKFVNIFV